MLSLGPKLGPKWSKWPNPYQEAMKIKQDHFFSWNEGSTEHRFFIKILNYGFEGWKLAQFGPNFGQNVHNYVSWPKKIKQGQFSTWYYNENIWFFNPN